ncbi:hypothetical protein [Vibrio vulnificus]|uniref:hypothetical protein n=1 Tax=Vibrio vulnificus TaxID=672 RepID=UPI001028D75E|nr:hypothetical protein [Vibrio vulnificus]RZP88966.1 hypothetical protein D8T54_20275 [Vibrio vulnificus]
MTNKKQRTRSAETAHHTTYEESMESKLCKLRARTLLLGDIPQKYLDIEHDCCHKHKGDVSRLNSKDRADLELLQAYLEEYGYPYYKGNGKPAKWLTVWQKKAIEAFCQFIDDPRRCHGGQLMGLHQCKSIMKTLQFKQRVTLVKVVTTLFCLMSVDGYRIGRYANKRKNETPVYDERGFELLRAIPHYEIRSLHEHIWREAISETKYKDTIKMLKLAGFFEVASCFLSNTEASVRRQELREQGASQEEIEAVPIVKSEPAYKWFQHRFLEILGVKMKSDIGKKKDVMIDSIERAKASMVRKRLSGMYVTYSPTSDGFWTKKRKEFLVRLGLPRYQQAARPDPNPYGDDVLPELEQYWH